MRDLASRIRSIFAGKRVLVAGDIVADQFLMGTITRVSREAPVFILRHDETETRLGGAANAAANVASLGAEPLLIGLFGSDSAADELRKAMERSGIHANYVLTSPDLSTTTKLRVIGGHTNSARKQVIRIDYENHSPIGQTLRDRLTENLRRAAKDVDAIVFSDYSYGVCDRELCDAASEIAKAASIPFVVDSRFRLSEFRGATSATPNQEEVEAILGRSFVDSDAEQIRELFGLGSLLVTLGSKGMALAEAGSPVVSIAAVGSDQPVDVTGAGDTVIAAFALGLASGLSNLDSARVANHAGGIAVMKHGTSVVRIEELERSLAENEPETIGAAANEN